MSAQESFDELSFYTLAHGDPRFIHQHAVDAFAVQNATDDTKTIAIVFGLVGLYLFLERGFTGRQVQLTHMRLAKRRRDWPRPQLPMQRGSITVAEVVQASPGPDRDRAIEAWCAAVWEPNHATRDLIANLLRNELDIR